MVVPHRLKECDIRVWRGLVYTRLQISLSYAWVFTVQPQPAADTKHEPGWTYSVAWTQFFFSGFSSKFLYGQHVVMVCRWFDACRLFAFNGSVEPNCSLVQPWWPFHFLCRGCSIFLLLFWSWSSGIFSSSGLDHQESSPLLVWIIRNLLLFYSS